MRGSQNGFQTWSNWRGNNRIPAQQQIIRGFFQKHLAKWLSLLGISEEVIKMASILMSQQKSRSRKRHQFWCHRRKSAPIWSLVLSTTDKIRQFWAENKLFSRKAHKNRFFVLYPLRDKKISFNPQFLAFLDGYPLREKKEIYQSGLFLILLDAYQMGEKFSKPFIKIEFSCSTTWGEKNYCGKGAVFGYLRCLPIEGRKIFFQKA